MIAVAVVLASGAGASAEVVSDPEVIDMEPVRVVGYQNGKPSDGHKMTTKLVRKK